ncbi:hypothetical protein PROFUN_04595 [Planoprotostelium fungivorum]|uniref:Calponin-homology (CH) domain-containing protein n=1 Tax=Planoprotostelium fungivorum TaxID=1890364 RepID=A0A2P6NUM8_9EUKA|nr:hypothetical protein PROFUN_04595 [Planoprotostelium fungivorum]
MSDTKDQQEITQWITQTTNVDSQGQSLGEYLHNSIVLCKLINEINPGTIPSESYEGEGEDLPPVQVFTNIRLFLEACKDLGVPESALFRTSHLYDQTNISQVEQCLRLLKRIAEDRQKVQEDIQITQTKVKTVKLTREARSRLRADSNLFYSGDEEEVNVTKRKPKIVQKPKPKRESFFLFELLGGFGNYIVAPLLGGITFGIAIKIGQNLFGRAALFPPRT